MSRKSAQFQSPDKDSYPLFEQHSLSFFTEFSKSKKNRKCANGIDFIMLKVKHVPRDHL